MNCWSEHEATNTARKLVRGLQWLDVCLTKEAVDFEVDFFPQDQWKP